MAALQIPETPWPHCGRTLKKARLRLDTREGALGARPRGAAVVPSDLEASLLYQRITHSNDGARMPPPALSNKTLSDEQIVAKTAEFRTKIDNGASLDDLLPEAFATVREAAKRTLIVRDEGIFEKLSAIKSRSPAHWDRTGSMRSFPTHNRHRKD